MKIAIIGSGISGLTCAYMLNKKHDITIFEKNDYIGGHTHTHEIEHNGIKWNVDSGTIPVIFESPEPSPSKVAAT